jgi:hypothetical protein
MAIIGTVVLASCGILGGANNPRRDEDAGIRPSAAAPAEVWSGLSWSDVTFEIPSAESPDVFEQMVAVAGDEDGFVAIGSSSGPGGYDARIWQSDDALDWRLVESPLLEGLELQDVAVAAGLFLAVGGSGNDPEDARASLLSSRDGVAWVEADSIPGAFAGKAAAGPPGFAVILAVGDEDTDLLFSPDGASWTRVPGADVTPGAQIRDIAWAATGWLAVGSVGDRAAAWRSIDGMSWTEDPLPAAGPVDGILDVVAYEVVPGRWATLVLGLDLAPSCAEDDDWCGKYQAAWSWTAQTGWARLPESNWLLDRGHGVSVHAAGDAGFLYLFGPDVRTSADGWEWLPLEGSVPPAGSGPPEDDVLAQAWPLDVVVVGDQVVGVGTLASAPMLEAWFGSAQVSR